MRVGRRGGSAAPLAALAMAIAGLDERRRHLEADRAAVAATGEWQLGHVVSVSLRGPGAEAEVDQPLLVRRADDRLAVDLLQRQPLDAPALDGLGQRRQRRVDARVVGLDEHLQALAAALDEQHRLGARQHHVGAGLAGGTAGRVGPLQRRPVRLRGIGRGEHDRRRRVVVLLRPQALDRARQRELRAAEAFDEVAAPRDADRLQRRERVIERGEAARDALGQHQLAGDDAVALEQQLGLRAAPRRRIVVAAEQARRSATSGPGRRAGRRAGATRTSAARPARAATTPASR